MLSPKKSSKKLNPVTKPHVKRGDTVMIIAGKDKGKTGTVKRVFRDRGKVLVEGLNLMKKAVRPNPYLGERGGIIEREAPLPLSKVMVYDIKAGKVTRVGHETLTGSDGKPRRVRVARKTGEHLDT